MHAPRMQNLRCYPLDATCSSFRDWPKIKKNITTKDSASLFSPKKQFGKIQPKHNLETHFIETQHNNNSWLMARTMWLSGILFLNRCGILFFDQHQILWPILSLEEQNSLFLHFSISLHTFIIWYFMIGRGELLQLPKPPKDSLIILEIHPWSGAIL